MSSLFYYWSPTSLEAFEKCPRAWYFNHEQETMSAPLALGIFMHRRVSQLKTNPRFHSAKAWANTCAHYWMQTVGKKNELRGQYIAWKDKDECKSMIGRIYNMCKEHFDRFMSEPKPVFSYSKKGIKKTDWAIDDFYFDSIGIRGEIDEIRPGMVIRDYKTGIRGFLEKRTPYKYQPSFYILSYMYLAHTDPAFRSLIGVNEEKARQWCGNPIYLDPEIKFEYYMLEQDLLKNELGGLVKDEQGKFIKKNDPPIIETTRNNLDYSELRQKIIHENFSRFEMEETNSYPARRDTHCGYCSHKEKCLEMTKGLPDKPRQKRFFPPEFQALMLHKPIDPFIYQPQNPNTPIYNPKSIAARTLRIESTPPMQKPRQLKFSFRKRKKSLDEL